MIDTADTDSGVHADAEKGVNIVRSAATSNSFGVDAKKSSKMM